MQLPRLNVARDHAIQELRAVIAYGQKLLINPPMGTTPNGLSMLDRTMKMLDWQVKVLARVNILFDKSVVGNREVFRLDTQTPRLTVLQDILDELERQKAQEQLLHANNTAELAKVIANLQYQFDHFNIERVQLHAKLLLKCKDHYNSAKYDDAVFNALKVLEGELRACTDQKPDSIGIALVAFVLNPSNPLVKFSERTDEREAVHALYRGAIGVFKNPLSHRYLDIDDKRRAFKILVFASLLLELLDEARSIKPADPLQIEAPKSVDNL